MFIRKKTEIEKADLLGPQLVGGATELAREIMEELDKRYNVRLRDEDNRAQFGIEVLAFYIHIIDHFAFDILGVAGRELFFDRFCETIEAELREAIGEGIPADEFVKTLRETHNRRMSEYVRYKFPEPGQPPKDTLFWEFGKILFAYTNGPNPVTLMAFLIPFIIMSSDDLLTKVMKVEKVLRN